MLGNFDRDNNIIHQDDRSEFTHDSDDVEIINTLASWPEKPVWITADLKQRTKPAERIAFRDSGMTIFFRRKNNGDPHFQALKMLAVWPSVVNTAKNARVPTVFEIPAGTIGGKLNVKIEQVCLTSDLK
jgi:hypothetical protein